MVLLKAQIFINPTNDDIREALTLLGNMLKSICDASGNLYLWDGDALEHRQVMDRYGIPDDLYYTAQRYYKDHGGEQQLAEYAAFWRDSIKRKNWIDGEWFNTG